MKKSKQEQDRQKYKVNIIGEFTAKTIFRNQMQKLKL